MHDDILYSVLIPAYNAEAYLEECLDSVLAQTHRNLQVVVIDDGSTDRTAEILNRYAAKDNRLEVVHRENRGVATTRLELFKMAKGKYINFVDADDTVEPEMAEVMIGVLEKTGADIAVCGMTNTLDRSFSITETPAPEIEKISGAQARREFLEHRRLVTLLQSDPTRRLCGSKLPPGNPLWRRRRHVMAHPQTRQLANLCFGASISLPCECGLCLACTNRFGKIFWHIGVA